MCFISQLVSQVLFLSLYVPFDEELRFGVIWAYRSWMYSMVRCSPAHNLSTYFFLKFPETMVSNKRKIGRRACVNEIKSLFSCYTGHFFRSRRKRAIVSKAPQTHVCSVGWQLLKESVSFFLAPEIKLEYKWNHRIFYYLSDFFKTSLIYQSLLHHSYKSSSIIFWF